MGFTDEVKAEIKPTRECETCKWIREHEDQDLMDELKAVLADPAIPSPAIHKALVARGYPLTNSAMRNHRRNCDIH